MAAPHQPRVPIVQESQATGEIASLYDEIRAYFGFGFVPDIMKMASTRPDISRLLFDGYKVMFGGGHLPRDIKEMIATVVSQANSCRY